MSKTTSLRLELTGSTQGIYFPGQCVTGSVNVNLEQPIECINLHVQLIGQADVSWTETRAQGNSEYYSAEEEYWNSDIILKEPDDGTSKLVLPTGTFTYPFKFCLPESLPASFNSSIGRVTYTITSRIKRPWYKFDIKAVRIISVVGIVDLNVPPPVTMNTPGSFNTQQDDYFTEKSKNICCLCCTSGPVQLRISLPRKSFVPGDNVKFSVEMCNFSSRNVSRTLCSFNQTSTYHASGRSKVVDLIIKTLEGPMLPRGGSEIWTDILSPLRIPPVPPSGLAGAKIIDVQYILKFEIKFKRLALPLEAEVPIIIGTVPLRSTFTNFQPCSEYLPQSENSTNEETTSTGFLPGETQGYGIFGVSSGSGQGIYPQVADIQRMQITQAPIFRLYSDLPAFKFIKSAVNLNKTFDYEDQLMTATNCEQSDESTDTRPEKYHPFCIFFQKSSNS